MIKGGCDPGFIWDGPEGGLEKGSGLRIAAPLCHQHAQNKGSLGLDWPIRGLDHFGQFLAFGKGFTGGSLEFLGANRGVF